MWLIWWTLIFTWACAITTPPTNNNACSQCLRRFWSAVVNEGQHIPVHKWQPGGRLRYTYSHSKLSIPWTALSQAYIIKLIRWPIQYPVVSRNYNVVARQWPTAGVMTIQPILAHEDSASVAFPIFVDWEVVNLPSDQKSLTPPFILNS